MLFNNKRITETKSKMSDDSQKSKGYTKPDGGYKLYYNDVLRSGQDEYEIRNWIGSGTFGQVVKCLKKSSDQLVAVKILKNNPEYVKDNKIEKYMVEKILKNTCDEFNFVQIFDSFVHKNHVCFAFELLEVNLEEFLKCNVIPAKAVCYILHQLLMGLVRLKQLGIVHADIKPENIMLVDSVRFPYRVKLIDFGSATNIGAVKQGDYITTRPYRSPELILGLGYTEKIDIWSLGCIAAELLIQETLYPGFSEHDLIRRICEMQGLPPNSMLEHGLKTMIFFNLTREGYQFKAIQDSTHENLYVSKIKQLQDIVSFNVSSLLENKEWLEEIFDRTEVTSLITDMLQMDPDKRITPEEALNRSYICGECRLDELAKKQ